MRIQNEPKAYGLLAGLTVFLLGLIVNASCACARPDVITAHREYDAAVQIDAACMRVDEHGAISMTGWYGSGAIVSGRRLITAAHVADTAGLICSFTVKTSDGSIKGVQPLVSLPDVDVASMELLSDESDFATRGVSFGIKPLIGSKVCAAAGFPHVARKCGEVQPYADPPGDIGIGIVVEPGNSGAGLYDDQGRLVGVVTHLVYCANGQWCSGRAASLEGHVKDLLP